MSIMSITGLYVVGCIICLFLVCIVERIHNKMKKKRINRDLRKTCRQEDYKKVISEYLLDLRKRNKTLPIRHLETLYDMYDDIAGGHSEARARNVIKNAKPYEIDKKP